MNETGIPCFKCKKRSGIDCAGRKPDESTLCHQCLKERLAEDAKLQARHLASYMDGVADVGGRQKVRQVWDLISQDEKDELRKIIGDGGVDRILSVKSARVGGQWAGQVHKIAEGAKTTVRADALRAVIADIRGQTSDSGAVDIADKAVLWARAADAFPYTTEVMENAVERIAEMAASGVCPCGCHDPEIRESFNHHDCTECWVSLIHGICDECTLTLREPMRRMAVAEMALRKRLMDTGVQFCDVSRRIAWRPWKPKEPFGDELTNVPMDGLMFLTDTGCIKHFSKLRDDELVEMATSFPAFAKHVMRQHRLDISG